MLFQVFKKLGKKEKKDSMEQDFSDSTQKAGSDGLKKNDKKD